ncbi:MAG: transposase [Mesorhizobium sp.]|nr:MAG: transposase [Mesorhizobium sp.]
MADYRGRPVAFALTPGNIADITMAIPLIGMVAKPKRLLADKAYDADSLRNWLKRARMKAVIPGISPTKPHRAHVLQAQELAPHRNTIRSPCTELPLSPGSRCNHFILDLDESST